MNDGFTPQLHLGLTLQELQLYDFQVECSHLGKEAANQQLERLANSDGLTGVANRHRFDQYLHDCWQQQVGGTSQLSLILCDVDFFKLYNDTYGHQAGDECLRLVAGAIHSTVKRSPDLVARYGGEEFAVILPFTPTVEAVQVAEAIRQAVKALRISYHN